MLLIYSLLLHLSYSYAHSLFYFHCCLQSKCDLPTKHSLHNSRYTYCQKTQDPLGCYLKLDSEFISCGIKNHCINGKTLKYQEPCGHEECWFYQSEVNTAVDTLQMLNRSWWAEKNEVIKELEDDVCATEACVCAFSCKTYQYIEGCDCM